ncbi:ABC transporter ATP-binding protein [Parageobacillus thermoglucosidasius]|uniref:Multidrug ABC transporter ATP-binding protein n=1 Tax=Parageobacillus thermoglucosidasius TaxID=1426 RepID=A0AAN0YPG3_PARTM|nr:ATP-binding cassette domain-containing protein [Parageobacillus thermoglucosidasius]ALF10885.1 multidrug ABC transporter ATP-binding protein [Parageobacillus thermoglucosidasius]ANZ30962.1 multidrug ABC transporter ATP-binding protein [Parageobacillus thermoglucosidasius]APM81699.1 multidrug ABC transporter ATP-binding protein [Parageobacillus thermoglucosidasius]KJX69154.1 multidrug ABC transporter ATP-binding protein [Parageobacillus thermoglucosidasius]RDE25431.1 ATP-binding cassette dom
MSIISLKNVSKAYKGLTLFDGVDLNVEKGKIYGIVGPNGSGKSVLFKMICGFVFPDEGTIIVEGVEIGKGKRFPDNFGIIIDRPGYIANKTGFQNLKELALIRGKISDEKIFETMEMVGLQPHAKQKVKHYSLGMKQKLAIAQAIMEDQQVLILDEPFNALDAESVDRIRNLLLSFKNEGRTILLTSHNQEDINILCDHVFRINKHKLEPVEL